MGDDIGFDAYLEHQEKMWILQARCPKNTVTPVNEKLPCEWKFSEDGLYYCNLCGETIDI